jgi:hypothetical protein
MFHLPKATQEEMLDEIEIMARDSFGYGRWVAPIWFIGPEQGGEDNCKRAEVFLKLQSEGLCDCKAFHDAIGVHQWHGLHGIKAKPQHTWKRLLIFLSSLCGYKSDNDTLLAYQKQRWGGRESHTCVIEIDGLSAKSLGKKDSDHKKLISEYRVSRTKTIRSNLLRYKPRIVVMYAYTPTIDNFSHQVVPGLARGGMMEHQGTLFARLPHPAASVTGNSFEGWMAYGELAGRIVGKDDLGSELLSTLNFGFQALVKERSANRQEFNGVALGLAQRLHREHRRSAE